MVKMNSMVLLFLLSYWFVQPAMAYENIYDRTPVGVIEIKTLPAAVSLETQTTGDYFSSDDALFMRLFRYIDHNDLSMTVPVEADTSPGAMRFFIGSAQIDSMPTDQESVHVRALPERSVVSAGLRGGYTKQLFNQGVNSLRAWLDSNPSWIPAGDPYVVYWNGPFVPGFLKRSEVHIPLMPVEQ